MITALIKKSYLAESNSLDEFLIQTDEVGRLFGVVFPKSFPKVLKMDPVFPNSVDDNLIQYYCLNVEKEYEETFLNYLISRDEIESAYIKPPEGVPG